MKLLSIVLLSLISSMASADIITSKVVGTVVAAEEMCPGDAMCLVNGTQLTLSLWLPSSCSVLSDVKYKISDDRKTVDIDATATTDDTMTCAAVITDTLVDLSLIDVYPTFNVSFDQGKEVFTVDKYF